MSFENNNPGQQKIKEYAARIKAGESKAEITKDLPEIFKSSIEQELQETATATAAEDQLKTERRIEEIREALGIAAKNESANAETPFNSFSVSNGETDTGVFWYQYRNEKAKQLKELGEFVWGKERLYFDLKLEDLERMRDLAMRIAGEIKVAVAFKYLDEQKTLAIQKDGTETRFVANFATEDDAKKFLQALKKDPTYASFVSDRNLSHNGIRIDEIAEYASGFREGRAALERIMQGSPVGNNAYVYKAESGKEISMSISQYEEFKKQYEQYQSEIAKKQQEWLEIFKK